MTTRASRFFGVVSLILGLASLLNAPTASGQARFLNLTWVDRSGDVIGVIGDRGEYRGLDISPDGRYVAVHGHVGTGGDIWLFDQQGRATRLVAEATGVEDNAHPIFSPDGTRVVYSALRDGSWGLYIRAVDGDDEELVHTSGRGMVPMSWSPDGRHIVFWENTGIEWVLPLEGDRTPFRLMDAPSSHSQISPDGRWVAYLANGDVWIRAFPDGAEAWQVSNNGGLFPRWRGDGRELYYTSAISLGMIMAAEISVYGDAIEISESRGLFDTEYLNLNHPTNYHTFAVSSDGQRFLIPRPEPDTLVVADHESGELRTLGSDLYTAPKISPDGTRIAVIRGQRSAWVVDIESGDRRQIGALDEERRFALAPEWAPDSETVAYLAIDIAAGRDALHFADASREGRPESEVMLPGIGGSLIGFAPDGLSVIYFSPQLGGDVFFGIALAGDHELTEIARSETGMIGPRLSPDGRHLAYHTNALNTNEVWVRAFDSASGELGEPVRVGGGFGMTSWRNDGQALYYIGAERELMSVTVRTAPALVIGSPEPLMDVPQGVPSTVLNFDQTGSVSSDGRLVAFAVPPEETPRALTELRVVDRSGRVLATPGEPGLYGGRPMISPDGTKIATGLANLETNITELWLFDLETDTSRMFLADRNLNSWIWSEDGEELIYAIMDFNSPEGGAIYRASTSASATQPPELVYRHYPGTGFNLIDWSADGRFVVFNSGGVAYVLPLDRDAEPVEVIREEFAVNQALLSPDSRYILYSSDETDIFNAWLWSFDPEALTLGPQTEKWQLSTDGSTGPHSWGRDGREITFRNNGAIHTVELRFTPEFRAEPPRRLFAQPEGGGNASASRDGERWVFFAPAIGAR